MDVSGPPTIYLHKLLARFEGSASSLCRSLSRMRSYARGNIGGTTCIEARWPNRLEAAVLLAGRVHRFDGFLTFCRFWGLGYIIENHSILSTEPIDKFY